MICTYRARRQPRNPWDIIRINDLRERPQFAVTLNPIRKFVELSILSYAGSLQTIRFEGAESCVLWGPRGLQVHGFKSCPRSECRLDFLTRGNGFLAGGLKIGGTLKSIPFSP
ncbi:hypothetical protein E2C01_080323 [Portunus trituberculatus]|uniref:Uncharacterized protein n=1 Tax=Portunus trituberculatus TaxID=210409 RepID=A0A5B7IP02_PORTR|nr:hypothetical protein [Portunus trituberculatus]